MAPSAALRSRISAFEALEAESSSHQNIKNRVQLAPLGRTSTVVEPRNEQNILDSDSTSPTADALFAIPAIQPVPSPSRPSSPIALGRKSSLIDFSELSSPSLKPISTNGTGSTISSSSTSESSKKPQLPPRVSPRLPPLPPRKPSITSLKATSTTVPPPLPKRHASSPTSSSSALKPPDSPSSLLLPSGSHTYPPTSSRPGFQGRHMPNSSTSSFHSVSLSSDGGGDTRDSLETRDSLDGSYEAVSSTAATSPTTHEWEHDLFPPPKLPQRQSQPTSLPFMSNPQSTPRRPAPPPPQRQHKQHGSSATVPLHQRPTPIPPNARKRYDALFERNISQNPHEGHTSGWRALSVDLLTNGEAPEFHNEKLNVERLDGNTIKLIWSCSKLPRARLREIWNECDPEHLGSLDRDAFAIGMWRIDEELSRGPKNARLSPLKAIAISYAPRAPPPPLRKPNFLLR